MINTDIYKDIAERTDGAVMLGVVGPVRTGKSTFIKRFMETLVIPNISDVYMKERARDELPQSGSGRTIMTAEPKFVPEEAVDISLDDETSLSVRLIDCVGYMVKGASGQFDESGERMVTTPWFDHEISLTEAAESGTHKVIAEHSTIGIVITTDGSICDIPRADYIEPEERVVAELKEISKPFIMLLNCENPDSDDAIALSSELEGKYDVPCIRVNCQQLNERDISDIISTVLMEFPIAEFAIELPAWLDALDDDSDIKKRLYSELLTSAEELSCMRDVKPMLNAVSQSEIISSAQIKSSEMGSGRLRVQLSMPNELYYMQISQQTGLEISNDKALFSYLKEFSSVQKEYEHIKSALDDVKNKGYGVVYPTRDEMTIEEPKIVKQGGRYVVKLKASAPAIHMMKTGVVTELTPEFGGENHSDELMGFLIQGIDGDMSKLWESNLFGKSLYDIAEEGLAERIEKLPENIKGKLQDTLQRIINNGNGTLICILL